MAEAKTKWNRPAVGEMYAIMPGTRPGEWWIVTSPDGDLVTINARVVATCEETQLPAVRTLIAKANSSVSS